MALIVAGAVERQPARSNQAATVHSSLRPPLKKRGTTIAILYSPYQLIQNPAGFAKLHRFPPRLFH
jgi:hypothetical protein